MSIRYAEKFSSDRVRLPGKGVAASLGPRWARQIPGRRTEVDTLGAEGVWGEETEEPGEGGGSGHSAGVELVMDGHDDGDGYSSRSSGMELRYSR